MTTYDDKRLVVSKLLYNPYNLYQLKIFETQVWVVHLVKSNLKDDWHYCTCGITTMIYNGLIHIKFNPTDTRLFSRDVIELDSCTQDIQSFAATYLLYRGL